MRLIAAAALFATAALAQTGDGRVFHFLNIASPQSMQEFANAARVIAQVGEVAVDPPSRSFRLAANPTQVALAQWLLDSLDQPSAPGTFQCRDTGYAGADRDAAVKVCYPVHIPNPQSMQETVNAVRSIAETQYVAAFYAAPAIVLRASAEKVALGEWIIRNADEAFAGAVDRSTRQTRFQDTLDAVARRREAARMYLPQTIRSPQQLQETVNVLRSILEIQHIVAFTIPAGILLRANDQEADSADWLMRQLDTPSLAPASADFAGQVVRTLTVPGSPTAPELAAAVNRIRTTTGMQRVVAYSARNTIVLRGTSGQAAAAEALLR